MTPLLITCASLWIVILIGFPRVGCQISEIELAMAPWSFDDQYSGCEEAMANEITSTGLLQKELDMNSNLKGEWEKAKAEWDARRGNSTLPTLPAGFKDEHGIALLVYSGSFYSKLNKAVRMTGFTVQSYMEHFNFKVLHFYVTRALQLLKNNCYPSCQTVYRGVKGVHFVPKQGIGKTVRFGQFTSTSMNKEVAKFFGNDSFFTITTCLGPCISSYAYLQTEQELLLPAYEVFNVTRFNSNDHTFVLNSTGNTCSNYNCTYLEGGKIDTCSRSAPRAVLASPIATTSQLFSAVTLLIHAAAMKLFL